MGTLTNSECIRVSTHYIADERDAEMSDSHLVVVIRQIMYHSCCIAGFAISTGIMCVWRYQDLFWCSQKRGDVNCSRVYLMSVQAEYPQLERVLLKNQYRRVPLLL